MRFIITPFFVLACAIFMLPTCSTTVQAQEIAGVKCVVDGDRNAQKQFKANHAGGEVYFCCKHCAESFNADRSPFLTRANHQLVVTQQYSQSACPIAGQSFDTTNTTKVGGVEVAFCCAACKSKIDSAVDLQSKAELVFGPKSFGRGFSKTKTADTPNVDVAPKAIDLSTIKCVVDPTRVAVKKFAADYRSGTVYFCCRGCLSTYKSDHERFSTQANLQLVATKQFSQQSCPLTGGDIDNATMIKIGGAPVYICCQQCQNDLDSATDEQKMAMVFGDVAFEKSFMKTTEESSASVLPKTAEDYSIAPEELADPGT